MRQGELLGLRTVEDTEPFALLDGGGVAASPDGRRLAYWHRDLGDSTRADLRVIDLLVGTEQSIKQVDGDMASAIAWRSDGAALVITAVSLQGQRSGIDPPPAYTAISTVDLASGQVREIRRLDEARFHPLVWNATNKVITGVDSGVGGIHAVLRFREDGSPLGSTSGDQEFAEVADASRDARLILGRYAYFDSSTMYSGVTLVAADSPSIIGRRATRDGAFLVAAKLRPGANEIVALVRTGDAPPRYALEIWPTSPGGSARPIWVSPDPAPYGGGDLLLRVDGKVAYIRTDGNPPEPSWRAVDLDTATEAPLSLGRGGIEGPSFFVSDEAIRKLTLPKPTAVVSRADAIGTIRALQTVVRADRSEAKLVIWREVVGMLLWRVDPKATQPGAAVWAVAVSGDLRARAGDVITKMPWGVWFVDATTSTILDFSGDTRGTWPWFWDELPDRS